MAAGVMPGMRWAWPMVSGRTRSSFCCTSAAFDYAAVRGLSAEVQQKLERVRPQTVGQAQRIPGMTPAAVSLLLVHLERSRRSKVA